MDVCKAFWFAIKLMLISLSWVHSIIDDLDYQSGDMAASLGGDGASTG